MRSASGITSRDLEAQSVAGIILAAGSSSRFGDIKQLLLWQEKNLVNTIIESAQLAELDPIIVVLGANAEEIETTIVDPDVQIVVNREWENGQSTSLKAGVKAIVKPVAGAVFLLSDQPQISVNLISSVITEGLRTGKVIVPVINDRRANPVYFPAACFPLFEKLEGDVGGRQIIGDCPHTTLPWLDDWMARDIDTSESYAVLREHFGL